MKKVFKLEGLNCAHCASKIEEKVGKLEGVKSVMVNFMTTKMTLESENMEEIVEKVKKEFPNDEILGDLSDFFKVIGDGTRIRILWALDVSEMCVCDIANVLNMTKSAVSHQLRALREADLVKFRKSGKEVLYSLADNHVKEIFEQGLVHIQEEKGED